MLYAAEYIWICGGLLLVCFGCLQEDMKMFRGKTKKERFVSYTKKLDQRYIYRQNILGGGVIGIFSFLYLSINLSGNTVMEKQSLELPIPIIR